MAAGRGRRKEEFSPLSVVVREHFNDETLFRCLLVDEKLHAALLMRRWNRRDGNHRRGELDAATNILECANISQTQGKP
ncbi:hypothetical protein EJB05_18042, partial [Eragrostis curvula]